MGLQFYFGGSGAGKSTAVYQEIINQSMEHPEKNYLIIVPDQFTMQTQKELVELHPRKGIMNIDVLSFGRLTYRIFEEVGVQNKPILDDTGKSLVLRRLAASKKNELQVIGRNLSKIGYIHEVKSAISEFMQYGIDRNQLGELIAFSSKRGSLQSKLQDLSILYDAFLTYLGEHYITTEGTLDVLCEALPKSGVVKNSVIVFDGFTGFTPIQNRVIKTLLSLAEKVIVTILLDTAEDPYQVDGEQRLFHLSKKTVEQLEQLTFEAGREREEDHFCRAIPVHRYENNTELAHLEQNLFRYPSAPYTGDVDKIHLLEMSSPREEITQICRKIRELLRQGYYYRDIAVISGNLSSYTDYVEREFAAFQIPCFLDETKGILLNPFIEYLKGALRVWDRNFSQDSVFHFLRSGLADFTRTEVDELELYVHAYGLRSFNQWNRSFTGRKKLSLSVEQLENLNGVRERMIKCLEPLHLEKQEGTPVTAAMRVQALYDFIVENKIAEKLEQYAADFEAEGNLSKAKEYSQIYRLVMELLDQIILLLGDEPMEGKEFLDILEAGFLEIEVGNIPQNVDRVLVGDMERTRLHNKIKILFLVGANDGNIPKAAGKGGIISDIDREFLVSSGMELAPSPRQQMFIQRLYLYMNMTKPSDQLFLSYYRVDAEGAAKRPSYLINVLQKMFPKLTVEMPEKDPLEEQAETRKESLRFLADGLRQFAEGTMEQEKESSYLALFQNYQENKDYCILYKRLVDGAFFAYQDTKLVKAVADLLYGKILTASVSRLEKYASCAYAYFLEYGLHLEEREEFSFEAVDMGNVFHGVLERFAEKLTEQGFTWMNFPKEEGEAMVEEAVDQYAALYGETVLFDTARSQYMITQMKRILKRTVETLQYQLRKGSFTPKRFEMSFESMEDCDTVNLKLKDHGKLKLQGRIDRLDTCEEDNRILVKVMDYKSGSKNFDLVSLYEGTRLQLVVYLNAAVEYLQKQNPGKEVVPAALLYYRVTDPVVEAFEGDSLERIEQKIRQELRMTGMVNADTDIVEKLDKELTSKSDVISVDRNKDGSYGKYSSVYGQEDIHTISDYVNYKIKRLGEEILEGNIAVSPLIEKEGSACTYCAYSAICGFDKRLPGFMEREPKVKENECLEEMRQELGEGSEG
ncbi:MAG: helicase-exonuclease AddAB subunit AddB [Lachnospiraceae bacterium]|nr:helicase-exonuclease AddAB subunit AddB [Lachnospiraceae bacterium]